MQTPIHGFVLLQPARVRELTRHAAPPAEIPMKEFYARESERYHVGITAIAKRVAEGQYPGLKRRYINKRVVMVALPYPAWINDTARHLPPGPPDPFCR